MLSLAGRRSSLFGDEIPYALFLEEYLAYGASKYSIIVIIYFELKNQHTKK